jgi:hypothetical protein
VRPQPDDHASGENNHPQQLEQVDAAIGKAEQAAAQVIECENGGRFHVPEIDIELQTCVKSTRVSEKQRLIPIQGYFQSDQARSDDDDKRRCVPAELESARCGIVGRSSAWYMHVSRAIRCIYRYMYPRARSAQVAILFSLRK